MLGGAPQDPWRLEAYLASNPFLPDINNELGTKNATYAASLASLERLVLYRFQNEYTVVPRGRCVAAPLGGSLRRCCHSRIF